MCARRPHGQPTRGKTAGNRLRRVDLFVALATPAVLRGGSPLVIDLGFGAKPWTALELAERWQRVNPALRVLGVEIDRERVEAALPYSDPPRLGFAVGGFDLTAVVGPASVRVVRCLNVLRQYDEADVTSALASIAEALEPCGLLIEGTSNPTGRMAAFDVYRRVPDGLAHELLVFATNFRAPTDPGDFRTIAPKRLIHRMLEPVPQRFFADWERAATQARSAAEPGTARHWAEAARLLRDAGWPIDQRRGLLARGFLSVRGDLATSP